MLTNVSGVRKANQSFWVWVSLIVVPIASWYLYIEISAIQSRQSIDVQITTLSEQSPEHARLVDVYRDCRQSGGSRIPKSECHLLVKRYAEEFGYPDIASEVIDEIISIEPLQ